jgi:hypothetical protein
MSKRARSSLYDQDSFYPKFISDLKKSKSQVIIESPYITIKRFNVLLPVLKRLADEDVQIVINTKPLDEHEAIFYYQSQAAIAGLQDLGIMVLFTVRHHRKLAILDKKIIWEGSLNILSQNDSCEIMSRINSSSNAEELISFLGLQKFLS